MSIAQLVDRCVHEVIEEQGRRAGERVAVIAGEGQLTYRELNDRATQLARHLVTLGVGPEVLVGIYADRSLQMAVGILGVLKAGGAYVPLDPEYPRARTDWVMEDARTPVVLTQRRLRDGLTTRGLQVVCLDADWPLIAGQSTQPLHGRATTADLAYVIYTSGTTGHPKGVMITHANLSHYLQALREPFDLAPGDAYLHTASFAFSSSVRQLLVPLSHGVTVVVATSEQRRDPLALFELIKRHQVTVADFVPSQWRNCIQALARQEPTARAALLDNQLRLCLSTSEPLRSDVPNAWLTDFQHSARFVNMFGQTETAGTVAVFPILAANDDPMKIVPLGRPLAATRIYLLDDSQQPVPPGSPGEVCIAGPSLARGYLNRPELTAAKFIRDPFSAEPGARLYRTGDLARYLPGGDLEYIGRMDDQVKIRGQRVELGEIEAGLRKHAAVREAVVVGREDPTGEKRLVAYVVSAAQPAPLDSVLRNFLREQLPEYMLPSTFVQLDSLPLTPNGKVSRRDLPDPDQARLSDGKAFLAPRNACEETLARIWAEVLQVDRVGVHDDFFELGGHSLLATQLISRVRSAFHVQMSLRSIFDTPTVAGLAETVRQALDGQGDGEEMNRLLAEVEGLSDEEVQQTLAEETAKEGA